MAVSELVTGPHVTFVDPRKHDDTRAMIGHAKRLYKMFKAQGIRPENIVFSVSGGREGLRAADLIVRFTGSCNRSGDNGCSGAQHEIQLEC